MTFLCKSLLRNEANDSTYHLLVQQCVCVCVCVCVCGGETSNRAQRPLFRAAVYSVREPFVECQEAAFHGRLFWC